MRRSILGAACSAALVMFATIGCSGTPPASQALATAPPAAAPSALPDAGPSQAPSVEPSSAPSPVLSPVIDPSAPAYATFEAAGFSNGARIDNVWMPLQPGRRWITEGVTIEGGERIPHKISFTVTSLTKMIAGVRTAVVWIEDISDGIVVEKEIAFYAQDDLGTVWYLGEHPEEFEDGEFVKAPTWIHGLQGARAGVKMFADPTLQTQALFQGWAPAVEWSDYGRIDEVEPEDCVRAGCYKDVIRFAESSLGEEGIYQLKSYAKGIGEIRVGWRGEAEAREELELKAVATLTSSALARYDALARDLEAHAYQISPKVYGQTEPSQ
jgi:hypothetical protein